MKPEVKAQIMEDNRRVRYQIQVMAMACEICALLFALHKVP
jgi:hypothetical protein